MKPRLRYLGCLLIALWTFLPLLCVFGSIAVADALGCRVDEGGTYPCMVFGRDIGETLNVMFVMGWFSFFTIPSGVVAGLIFLAVVVVSSIRARKAGP